MFELAEFILNRLIVFLFLSEVPVNIKIVNINGTFEMSIRLLPQQLSTFVDAKNKLRIKCSVASMNSG